MPRQATLASIPTWYNPRLAPPYPAYGQVIFNVPGTYNWTMPLEAKFVSVVCIGGGGSCNFLYPRAYRSTGTPTTPYIFADGNASGAGGGGLGYRTFYPGRSGYNSPLVPGNTYTVVVGRGGKAGNGIFAEADGTDSYFINGSTVKGGGGVRGDYTNQTTGSLFGGDGGSFVGDGGGRGGNGGSLVNISSIPNVSSFGYLAGGGGAGGYRGNGSPGANVGASMGNVIHTIGTLSGMGGLAYYGKAVNSPAGSPGCAGHGGGTSLFGERDNILSQYDSLKSNADSPYAVLLPNQYTYQHNYGTGGNVFTKARNGLSYWDPEIDDPTVVNLSKSPMFVFYYKY